MTDSLIQIQSKYGLLTTDHISLKNRIFCKNGKYEVSEGINHSENDIG